MNVIRCFDKKFLICFLSLTLGILIGRISSTYNLFLGNYSKRQTYHTNLKGFIHPTDHFQKRKSMKDVKTTTTTKVDIPSDLITSNPIEGVFCTALRQSELDIIRWVSTWLPKNGHVIDGGTHNGETLSNMDKFFDQSVHIHCFEPIHANVVIASKHKTDRCTIHESALISSNEQKITVVCRTPDCTDEQTTVSSNVIAADHMNKNYKMEVAAIRLPVFWAENKLKPPAFIKLDLQGVDFEVIRDIMDYEIPVIMYEWYKPGHTFATEIAFLETKGYNVYRVVKNGITMAKKTDPQPTSICFTVLAILNSNP
jgi:FkbM family methyltransferase